MAKEKKFKLSDMVSKDAEVNEIVDVFKQSGLSKLKIEIAGGSVEMELPVSVESPQITHAGATTISTPQTVETGAKVASPLVGTFYGAPAPGKPRFVEVGKQVKKGDVLCIIEAMKVMNEIKAPLAGVITAILVDEAQMVEYDEVLFTIE